LLADGLSFEQRIAARGAIATRSNSLHDYYSALMWLRFPRIKQAIHTLQMRGIAAHGSKQRSRHQQAITHLDEAGAWIFSDSAQLLELADQHAWKALFWQQREAWRTRSALGHIRAAIFGHAIFELMHSPHQTLAAKTIWLQLPSAFFALPQATQDDAMDGWISSALLQGSHGYDPKPLATLPLAGIPGWDAQSECEDFFDTRPCFRGKPAAREYSPPILIGADFSGPISK
jgi:hypothetical protein